MRAFTFFALAALTTACADLDAPTEPTEVAPDEVVAGLSPEPGIDASLDVVADDEGRFVYRPRKLRLPNLGEPRIEFPVARFPTVLPNEAGDEAGDEAATDDAANEAAGATADDAWPETDAAWPDEAPVRGDGDRPDAEGEAGDGDRPEAEGAAEEEMGEEEMGEEDEENQADGEDAG